VWTVWAQTCGMRLTWLGHATVLIELDGVRLLTDPVLRRSVLHLRRARAVPLSATGPPDIVLVSHLHWDHFDLPSLARLGRGTRIVVPSGAGRLLRRRGFERIEEVSEGSEVRAGPLRIRATYAEHKPGRGPWGAKVPALGYLIEGSSSVYFAGDTDLFAGMDGLHEGLDVALLPIAGWGPTLPPGHLDVDRAAEAVRRLRPRVTIPIHWGTLRPFHRRTPHAGDAAAADFAAKVAEVAPGVEVRVLDVGATCTV
jgi:L-ascorbate metabolism protein UlaG (beta-lactamase superfamily)